VKLAKAIPFTYKLGENKKAKGIRLVKKSRISKILFQVPNTR